MLVLRNLLTLQQIFSPKKVVSALSILVVAWSWMPIYNLSQASSKIVYPIQEMSKLECRFQKFSELTDNCKRQLPILKTKDYTKYIKQDGWYNDYTRIYTVLWGSSYKYWWDVWNGWHGGTDIATAEGTPVYAMAAWKVINAKYMPGWGNNVSIEHVIDGKKIVSNYSHLSKINTIYGSTVKAWAKIWEVGNTGNSFGNHLHFQIDLDTPFHPYYYDYAACPYSYSQISESDICFDELANNTLDPLAFLESNGAILDKVNYVSTTTTSSSSSSSRSSWVWSNTTWTLPEILYTYVHMDSPNDDIKQLQRALKTMGVYEWNATGKYSDIKQVLIAYQVETWVIPDKNADGAGYFWPKTRAQAQSDYKNYLASGDTLDNPLEFTTSRFGSNTSTTSSKIQNNIQVEKIAKKEVLTREEIEKREVEEFQSDFQIDLKFQDSLGNVGLWQTEIIKFTINKDNGRPFKGRTPSDITIETDESLVKVFPNTMYQFTDGKRDIKVTGLKTGATTLKVKLWDTVLKTFRVNVFNGDSKIYPKTGSVLSSKKIVFGEEKTWFVVMKDNNSTNLINLKYEGKFILKSDTDTQFCLKRTNLANIRNSLKTKCNPNDFKDEIEFDYSDTAAGILVFDYKVANTDANMRLINSEEKSLSNKSLLVTGPKGLTPEYVYSNEVVSLLERWIVDGISQWYFLEERDLSQADAYGWIENTLVELKKSTTSVGKRDQIQARIDEISQKDTSKYRYLTRRAFLEKATEMLVFDDVIPEITIKYKDLNSDENQLANLVFDTNNTWKDRFWENYYRPKETITRGEWAYLISRVLEKKTSEFVTLK